MITPDRATNSSTESSTVMTAASSTTVDAFKDLVKGTIALPLEAAKGMATGCATIAGIYGAITAFMNQGRFPLWQHVEVYAILAPFVLWAIAGYRFGTSYLPNVRLSELLPDAMSPPISEEAQRMHLINRETHLRSRIVEASILFWFAFIWAVVCVAFVRVPK